MAPRRSRGGAADGTPPDPEPLFFETPDAFRAWLAAHHDRDAVAWIGFHKKGTGRASITWPESVDVALCIGWIDGLRRSVDEASYQIRFTPRRVNSTWSVKNRDRMQELIADGLVHPAGLAAFEARSEERSGTYSFERDKEATLPAEFAAELHANLEASAYFDARPPWYRRTAIHWIMSAAREETRLRRLRQLIEHSAAGEHVPPLQRP